MNVYITVKGIVVRQCPHLKHHCMTVEELVSYWFPNDKSSIIMFWLVLEVARKNQRTVWAARLPCMISPS